MRVEVLIVTGVRPAYHEDDVADTIPRTMVGRDRGHARGRPDG